MRLCLLPCPVAACVCVCLCAFAQFRVHTHSDLPIQRKGHPKPGLLREPGSRSRSRWSGTPRLRKQKRKPVLLVTRCVFRTLICLVAQHRLSGSRGIHLISVRLLGCVYCGCGKSVTCVLNPLLTALCTPPGTTVVGS